MRAFKPRKVVERGGHLPRLPEGQQFRTQVLVGEIDAVDFVAQTLLES